MDFGTANQLAFCLLESAGSVIGEEGQAGWGRGQNSLAAIGALGVRKFCGKSIEPYLM
jgi:hypothetical protein